MFQRIILVVTTLAALLATGSLFAATWTTGGGTFSAAQYDANVANNGDDIRVDANTTFNIDADTSKLLGPTGIVVDPGILLTINFTNGAVIKLGSGPGNGGPSAITNNGTITVTGTAGGFDFSDNTGQILTIKGTLGGDVDANTIILGNNTLATGGASSIYDITFGGANAILDINHATTVRKIATMIDDATVRVANGIMLTGTVDVNGNTLTLDEPTGGTITAVQFDTIGGLLDVIESCAISAINMTVSTTIRVATNKTLTTTVDVNNNTLTLDEPDGGTITTVNLDTDDGMIDVLQNTTIGTCDLTGNATIRVAANKTLTTTGGVDTNTKTLTLPGAGTITQVDIDGAGGVVKVNESCALNTVNVTASGSLNVAENKTMTGTVNINACTLSLNDKGIITAASFVTAGGVLDVNETCEVTAVNLAANGSINVVAGKTLTALIDVNANTLSLNETGVPGTIQMDTANGVLDVNANSTPTAVNISNNVSVDVAEGRTLTADLNIGAYTLTLLGSGTVTKIMGTTGTVLANGSPQITTLQPSPGAGGTFTFSGIGSATVANLTPLDTAGEIFAKTGVGSLTVSNGFSFAGATGIKLNINGGTFSDTSGLNVVFGDDAEKIYVGNGATFETASDITGQSGAGTNFDAVPGSTVNFTKDGLLTLTATADDDFKLLGTVNVMDNCIVQMAGAYQSQFANVNIENRGSLINNVPNSTMLFSPNATVILKGTASGTLTINGQTAATPITVSTVGNVGQFTINRGSSNKLTVKYTALSNCIYISNTSGYADAELGTQMMGVTDEGNNINWWGPLTANAGPDKTIINGNSTTLDGGASGGHPPYTYAWTPTTGLQEDELTLASPTAAPLVTTEYTLTVTDSEGSTDTDTVTVTVTPALAVDAGPDQEIAPGESVTLQGSATGGSGQFAYTWTPTTGLDNPAIAEPTASPEETTEYTLTVTDLGDQGKMASDKVIVTVRSGIGQCGAGLCGMGGVSLLPLTLLGMMAYKWSWRRKSTKRLL